MAALAARGDRSGADALAELDHRDEAVAVSRRTISSCPGFGPRARTRRANRKRPRRTASAMLGRGVAERLVDRGRDALEAVDLAPRHLPAAEVALEPVTASSEPAASGRPWCRAQGASCFLLLGSSAGALSAFSSASPQNIASDCATRMRAPAIIPVAQQRDRAGKPLSPRVALRQRIEGLDQRRDQLGEARLIRIERGRLQPVESPAAASGQQLAPRGVRESSRRTCPCTLENAVGPG